MSVIEGTGWNCSIHDYSTSSLEEWNAHCFGNPEHTEEGSTACRNCGTKFVFTNLPWHKLQPDGSKNISLLCEACESQQMGKVKRSNVVE